MSWRRSPPTIVSTTDPGPRSYLGAMHGGGSLSKEIILPFVVWYEGLLAPNGE
jgi:hypothetical protein